MFKKFLRDVQDTAVRLTGVTPAAGPLREIHATKKKIRVAQGEVAKINAARTSMSSGTIRGQTATWGAESIATRGVPAEPSGPSRLQQDSDYEAAQRRRRRD